ncbi:HalOD1 output domain-containing protein [Halalkaliarchaeum sp. AArc-CO]|uniref:HalOD1 output domain-containing protein n=2 Tax=unclassified Halalkaliarchaeum TaxID=2678344 RepID=UPI00217EE64E|nr:HalOD1 output domain-containing protein [Halalkaliarchaeum sp. AArc-CO]
MTTTLMSDVEDVSVAGSVESPPGFEDQTPIYRDRYDPTKDGELATYLTVSVAKVMGVDPLDIEAVEKLPPIYDAIDATAVQRLFFAGDCVGVQRNEIRGAVTFPYAGRVIHIRADGTVSVYESG